MTNEEFFELALKIINQGGDDKEERDLRRLMIAHLDSRYSGRLLRLKMEAMLDK